MPTTPKPEPMGGRELFRLIMATRELQSQTAVVNGLVAALLADRQHAEDRAYDRGYAQATFDHEGTTAPTEGD